MTAEHEIVYCANVQTISYHIVPATCHMHFPDQQIWLKKLKSEVRLIHKSVLVYLNENPV